MAATWFWKDELGTFTNKEGATINLYAGNCLAVLIYEYPNSTQYQFEGFWGDEKHLQNMLGLTQKYKNNVLKEEGWVKIRLNTYFKDRVKKIAECFQRACIKQHWDFTIEYYYKEIKQEKAETKKGSDE